MIISGHQPNYLPYLGFFDKVKKSDIFIIGDDLQYSHKGFQNRNKIRIQEGWKWLDVPVYKAKSKISEIEIRNDVEVKGVNWCKKHFLEMQSNYRRSPYFESYASNLNKIYNKKYEKLMEINMEIINFILKEFDISTEIVFSSMFDLESTSTQRIVDMVNELKGDVYLTGDGGSDYLDLSLFGDIKVEFQNFVHPVYKQCYDGFESNMSAIDALFNIGKLPEKE